jgi:CRISPR system Cascade subunit CasE
MFLSCLLIDTGTNPDRPRPGRLWLRNLYHVHQRLCMAFPSKEREGRDPDFLAPYAPEDFPEQRHLADRKKTEVDPAILKQVHTERKADFGFLFRADPQPGGRVVIVIQSAAEPDWEYAFHNAKYLLAAPPDKPSKYDPAFTAGQRPRFRLVANPTRRLSKHSLERDGKPVEKWANKNGKGKRIPVPHDQLLDWLAGWRFHREGCEDDEPSGFSIDKGRTTVQAGYVYVKKTRDGNGQRLFSARYDGILEVTDADAFHNTLLRGIGPGKAFGFGLLSVAPEARPAGAVL